MRKKAVKKPARKAAAGVNKMTSEATNETLAKQIELLRPDTKDEAADEIKRMLVRFSNAEQNEIIASVLNAVESSRKRLVKVFEERLKLATEDLTEANEQVAALQRIREGGLERLCFTNSVKE